MVSANINMFYLYQLPVPRLEPTNIIFLNISKIVSRLLCTTQEFDELAIGVGLSGYQEGVTEPTQRAALQAELDALVAHLYGLTEESLRMCCPLFHW
jgi:hypothetical protein